MAMQGRALKAPPRRGGEGARADAGPALESAGKSRRLGETDEVGGLVHGHLAGREVIHRQAAAQIVEHGLERRAFGAEAPPERLTTYAETGGDGLGAGFAGVENGQEQALDPAAHRL